MNIKIDSLNKTILKCKKCPRLVNFVKKISTEKKEKIQAEVIMLMNIQTNIMLVKLILKQHGKIL